MPRAAIDNDSITVTTATRSEAEVREGLGAEAAPPAAAAPPVAAAADAAATPAIEQEADSDKPDPDVSEAARKLRGSRADARKARIQDEINALTRKREEERANYERERAERERAKTPPTEPKPADAAKPTADGTSAPTTFTFPTYEQYQVDHPEASWEDYVDARSDAKYDFRRNAERVVERRQAEERDIKDAFTRADGFQKAFTTEHPDYETKLKALDLKPFGVEVENGVVVKAPLQFVGLQRLLLRAGEAGPGILYYLADHPADVARLLDQRVTPGDQLEVWGEVKYAAKVSAPVTPKPAAAAAAAAPAAPLATPRTSAPVPLTAVPGSASVGRSPQQIAEDGDDADDYIAVRQPGLLKRAR